MKLQYHVLLRHFTLAVLFGLAWQPPTVHAQAIPTQDSYVVSAKVNQNNGGDVILAVQPGITTFIQFDFSMLPAGVTSSQVSKAMLRLFVSGITAPGKFDVYEVTGSWSENGITFSNAPSLGVLASSGVAVATANKNHFLLVDLTTAVQDWINNPSNNKGIALVGSPLSSISVSFDSKEAVNTSHEPRVEIALNGPVGAQGPQGVAGATGPTGPQGPPGPIAGVTAGTDLVGGGTVGNVTLSLDTTKVPQLAANNSFTGLQSVTGNSSGPMISAANSNQIGIYAQSGGASGISTGPAAIVGSSSTRVGVVGTSAGGDAILGVTTAPASAGVNGNGVSFGVYGTGANGVYGASSTSNGNGVYGTSTTGTGVYGQAAGASGLAPGGAAVLGDSGTYFGVLGTSAANEGVHGNTNGTSAAGVGGVSNGRGFGVSGTALGCPSTLPGCQLYGVGVRGESFGNSRFPDGNGSDGVDGFAHSPNGVGVAAINDAVGGTGVYASAAATGVGISGTAGLGGVGIFGSAFDNGITGQTGYGFKTDSNVTQDRGAGGWVKAMAYIDPSAQGGIAVTRCFNSQLTLLRFACGFTIIHNGEGINTLDFGFEVDDRFVLIASNNTGSFSQVLGFVNSAINTTACNCGLTTSNNQLTFTSFGASGRADVAFWVFVF